MRIISTRTRTTTSERGGEQLKKQLHIGHGFSVPADLLTQTIAILAKRGVGKTYTGSVFAEEFLERGLPVVALDPIGVWWGLRSSADGKGPGYSIPVFGGEHGDLPLADSSGKALAELVVNERIPAVLDVSLLRKNAQRKFVTDFAEELYQSNREALHVILDEADVFAPQRIMHGNERMFGAIDDIIRRGRARGIGVTMITQRPAVLHKDVLSQAEVLVAMQLIHARDRKAIEEWVVAHDAEGRFDDMKESLASLQVGEAWFWSPGWLDLYKKVKIRKRRTLDSSATPKAGAAKVVAKRLADIDLSAIEQQLEEATEQARQNDPKHLRAEIAKLKRELSSDDARDREIARLRDQLESQIKHHGELLEEAMAEGRQWAIDKMMAALEEIKQQSSGRALEELRHRGRERRRAEAKLPPIETMRATPTRPTPASNGDASIGSGERKILSVLAQHQDSGRTQVQVAMLSGYSSKSGGFRNYISKLRTSGLLEGGKDNLRITEAGLAALGDDWEPLPTGQALRDYWYDKAGGKAEGLILRCLCDAWPNPMSKDEVAEATGYSVTSGGFRNSLSRLRTLQLISGSAELVASQELFQHG